MEALFHEIHQAAGIGGLLAALAILVGSMAMAAITAQFVRVVRDYAHQSGKLATGLETLSGTLKEHQVAHTQSVELEREQTDALRILASEMRALGESVRHGETERAKEMLAMMRTLVERREAPREK